MNFFQGKRAESLHRRSHLQRGDSASWVAGAWNVQAESLVKSYLFTFKLKV